MPKPTDPGPETSTMSDVIAKLRSKADGLSKMLATETDSTKKNAIVQQRSALREAMSKLNDVTL